MDIPYLALATTKDNAKVHASLERLIKRWTARFLPQWRRHIDGALAFDYETKTIRFGHGIGESEAEQILALVKEQFPQYVGASSAGRDVH